MSNSVLEALTLLLADPICRFVTVTGPGGIGKTRIAIELASRLLTPSNAHLPSFTDGVWFVSLEAVDSPEGIVLAIGNAVNCPPANAGHVLEHLLSHLQAKHLLFILDNFEHLHHCCDLLIAILTRAPQIKLLVTSREALNVAEEWRYPLNGLPLQPDFHMENNPDQQADAAPPTSAVRLFAERARRLSPTFDFTSERSAIQHICQLVEGVPLAIELAATWTRILPCSAIADELKSDLAFLTSTMNHKPDRHRSMQAVFERSWELLDEEERFVFARLSVFHAGFQRRAAEEVTGASLKLLSAFIDKSLLRWEAANRYRVHELLRHYAAGKLKHFDEETETLERHCVYYAGFLAQREADLNGRRQRQALGEIAAELDNLRAAWRYATQHQRITDIQQAAYTFYLFYDYSSRYQEGYDLYEQTVQQLDKLLKDRRTKRASITETENMTESMIGSLLSELLCYLGWLSIRRGKLQHAHILLNRSQTLLTQLAIPPRVGLGIDPLVPLGTLANTTGDYSEATRLGEAARQRSEGNQDWGNLICAYYVLTNAAFARGRYTEARQNAMRACQLAEQLNERWFMAYLVADLGNIARATGDYAEAARQYDIGYTIREEFDDPEGMAVALANLGQVSLLQAEHESAQLQFQRSLTIYGEIGNPGGKATALYGLGMVAVAVGDYGLAVQHLQESLQIATAIGYASRLPSILVGIAELFLLTGESLLAAELLVATLRDPTSDHETRDRAHPILARCARLLSPDQYATTTRGRHILDLEAVSAALQRIGGGAKMLPTVKIAVTQASSRPAAADVSSILPSERLTERELSVLRLIAAGHSNRQIAEQLIITPGTAKWYVSEILSKLGVQSRTQAIGRAQMLGLLA